MGWRWKRYEKETDWRVIGNCLGWGFYTCHSYGESTGGKKLVDTEQNRCAIRTKGRNLKDKREWKGRMTSF